ncbi:MAG TPA: YopT-type cysteine protease domain-containing protein [Acetobacteraceae bacterium]|jgi:YopT-type cysteine protease-like protein|nr:YopT-type cysteine protease domain-containing protein [Acetobacteraceae bacterium]
MPDLDKSWEKVRAYMPRYVQMARANQAKAIVPFSQSLYLSIVDSNSTGACYGFSLGWLVFLRAPQSNGSSFVEEAFLMAASFKTLDEKGKRDAKFTGYQGQLNSYQMYWPSEYQTVDELKRAGLSLVKWDQQIPGHSSSMLKALTAHLTDGSKGEYFLIKSPNHAMAAAHHNGRYAFFDPNFGEAAFDSSNSFKEFVQKWMGQDKIQQSYKGVQGGRRDAPPAKHLSLQVCGFAVAK